jgi:hypothetical protein
MDKEDGEGGLVPVVTTVSGANQSVFAGDAASNDL